MGKIWGSSQKDHHAVMSDRRGQKSSDDGGGTTSDYKNVRLRLTARMKEGCMGNFLVWQDTVKKGHSLEMVMHVAMAPNSLSRL